MLMKPCRRMPGPRMRIRSVVIGDGIKRIANEIEDADLFQLHRMAGYQRSGSIAFSIRTPAALI